MYITKLSCKLTTASSQVINNLFKPDKKGGELELLLEQAEALAQEADGLQCNVTRDLEKLKASLSFSCLHLCAILGSHTGVFSANALPPLTQ